MYYITEKIIHSDRVGPMSLSLRESKTIHSIKNKIISRSFVLTNLFYTEDCLWKLLRKLQPLHSETSQILHYIFVRSEKNDIRPGLLFSSKQKREHELHKKRLEFKKNKPKSYVQREEEARNEGLSKPLSEENKGYKMMQKMGFKDGTGLGKTQSGIKEPIPINVKRSHSGVGREQHVKSIIKSRYNAKKQKLETKLSEFKESAKQKHLSSMLYKDYFKAQRMCEELDFKHVSYLFCLILVCGRVLILLWPKICVN